MMFKELKFRILEKFPSQADFAMIVKEHESKVSQIIHQRRKLSEQEAEVWSKALDCEKDFFNPVLK